MTVQEIREGFAKAVDRLQATVIRLPEAEYPPAEGTGTNAQIIAFRG